MVGLAGIAVRVVQLFVLKDIQTGLVWATKIATDPFHDIKLYHRAPLELLTGRYTRHTAERSPSRSSREIPPSWATRSPRKSPSRPQSRASRLDSSPARRSERLSRLAG